MTDTYKKFKRGWLGGNTKHIITSPMGYRRPPTKGASSQHQGNDIRAKMGTKIYAPCDGTVSMHKQKRGVGFGLYVILKSKTIYQFYFGHLSKVIKTGSVKEGDLIALTGGDFHKDPENSGCSRSAHLHFEVRTDKGCRVDGKYFVSDTWINKCTGAVMVSQNKNMPLITTNESDYTEEQNLAAEQTYSIGEADCTPIQEQDVSGSTDWEESEDEDKDNTNKDKIVKEGLVSGIWQIMKFVLDGDVANLRIRDAATSLQQGSLINFFQKVCQKPMVEFFGDTYGDQYYFIARKPPFDEEGMKKTMVAQGLFNTNGDYNGRDTIYDIYENDVVSSNISFNTQNIYSWYQFIPIYELGNADVLQYMIPAVLFPEYAAIWGSRSCIFRSPYRDFRNTNIVDKVKNGEKSEQADTEVRHTIYDLKYLIESNAYNPFVRQGTITILGNRRIKRGTFVRVFWNSLDCPEIFYVENVGQSYSVNTGGVNRTTTLTLSRGMLSEYMFDNSGATQMGYNKDKTNISYFKIIDFGADYEKNKGNIDMNKWREIISKWKVNITAFMFFLRKTHFIRHMNDSGILVTSKGNKKNVL